MVWGPNHHILGGSKAQGAPQGTNPALLRKGQLGYSWAPSSKESDFSKFKASLGCRTISCLRQNTTKRRLRLPWKKAVDGRSSLEPARFSSVGPTCLGKSQDEEEAVPGLGAPAFSLLPRRSLPAASGHKHFGGVQQPGSTWDPLGLCTEALRVPRPQSNKKARIATIWKSFQQEKWSQIVATKTEKTL